MKIEQKDAVLSECGKYRYRLTRRWGPGEVLVWVMLNPSTADANIDDPTIRRVRGFTKREGYDGFVVVNIYALRATDPKDLHENRTAYEPDNIKIVELEVFGRDVVVAWGNNVVRGPAWQKVRIALQYALSVRCLGFTKLGNPVHPLRQPKDISLVPYESYEDRS